MNEAQREQRRYACDLPRNDEVKIDERGNKYVIDNDGTSSSFSTFRG